MNCSNSLQTWVLNLMMMFWINGKSIAGGIATSSRSPCTFSPASFSPDVGIPCSKYKERTNAGQIVVSHGTEISNITWSSSNGNWLSNPVTVYLNDKNDQLVINNLKNKLMMESLPVKVDIFNDHIEHLSKQIIEAHKLDEQSQFRHPNSEKFVTCGRLFSSDDNKLQQNSVMLEASETFSQGLTVELNLQQLVQPNVTCSGLFPGQVVAVEGVNPLGDKIIAHKIFSPLPLPLAPKPSLEGSLHVVIAAGPFTQADNLLYQPLEDLVSYIKQNEPHLAIIIGPIVDVAHSMVIDGSLAETYEEFYNKVLSGIVDQLAGCQTQVVVVASARDAAQCQVYPVVPNVKRLSSRVIYVNDPSLLTVNGLVIGVSATDVLMHLSREEMQLPSQCGGDRLGRLAGHLLSQHNFYPLHPPPEDVSIDTALWENLCGLSVTPHILILPSDLRYFIKNVGDCVVVNPERLAKGQAGGSFARLCVKATKNVNDWMPTTHICGQILKI
ncbi:DNA polymerase alpha subunit B isoform X2 [Lycorma delicatula]|uniref:DNA polymerase alpha subunit B isoform X2 n=1 Tax=Lycorma delicatula TaxID=130591 RepID=UPI003F51A980